jgi:hypothetical protein
VEERLDLIRQDPWEVVRRGVQGIRIGVHQWVVQAAQPVMGEQDDQPVPVPGGYQAAARIEVRPGGLDQPLLQPLELGGPDAAFRIPAGVHRV